MPIAQKKPDFEFESRRGRYEKAIKRMIEKNSTLYHPENRADMHLARAKVTSPEKPIQKEGISAPLF